MELMLKTEKHNSTEKLALKFICWLVYLLQNLLSRYIYLRRDATKGKKLFVCLRVVNFFSTFINIVWKVY